MGTTNEMYQKTSKDLIPEILKYFNNSLRHYLHH